MDKKLYGHIFEDRGGVPVDQMHEFLAPFTPQSESNTRQIFDIDLRFHVKYNRIQPLYDSIQVLLKNKGALLIPNFKPFKEYCNSGDVLEFGGDYNQIMQKDYAKQSPPNGGLRPTEYYMPLLHANIIVGVRRCEDSCFGGIQFLVQDSLPHRPFAVVGLDLLHSMGVEVLWYLRSGLAFTANNGEFEMDAIADALLTRSGSLSEDSSHAFSPKNTSASNNDWELRLNRDYYFHKIEDPKTVITS
jgi:hypothetical protein